MMKEERILRYKSLSRRCRAGALIEMREGRWDRVEELLWGSLMGAVKAVAASRGRELRDEREIRGYVAILAGETKDRRMGDGFRQLSSFADVSYTVQDNRLSRDRLYQLAQRISYAVERLWEMTPTHEEPDDGPSP